jgi:hypothetical protein
MKSRSEIRSSLIDTITLLARASEQLDYEREVPHAYIPAELIEIYTSDTFHPKNQDFIDAFSEPELKSLARLYGLVCSASEASVLAKVHSVSDLQKLPEWREVMRFAKDLVVQLTKH